MVRLAKDCEFDCRDACLLLCVKLYEQCSGVRTQKNYAATFAQSHQSVCYTRNMFLSHVRSLVQGFPTSVV